RRGQGRGGRDREGGGGGQDGHARPGWQGGHHRGGGGGGGTPLAVVREDERAGGRQHAAHAVHERRLQIGHLAGATLAAQLARGLDDREDAVHPGVRVGEPAAVG